MGAARELGAIALLVLRSWQRMGPRARMGRAPEPTRGVSAVLMRLVFAAVIYNFGMLPARGVASHPHPDWSASWGALGLACYAFAIAFAVEVPYPRAPTSALKSGLLEMLPVSRLAHLVLLFGQSIWALLPLCALALTIHFELGGASSLAWALLLPLELFALCTLAGACLGKLLKLRLSPYWASRSSWLSSLILVVGIAAVQTAMVSRELAPPFALALGRALTGVDQPLCALELAFGIGLAALLFYRLEQRHELSEPVRAQATPSQLAKRADQRTLERLLMRREPGGSTHWFGVVVHLAYVGGLVAFLLKHVLPTRQVLNMAVIMCLQLVTTIGAQRAARGAMRDMLARPLLGALPLAPRSTLLAKVSAMRGTLLLVAAPLVLLLASAYGERELLPTLLWRLAAIFAAVSVYAEATVYVAFLTVGLGSTRPRAGAFGSLESILLMIPFASVVFAPDPWVAALSLATLCALTFEARRAALRVVDWLDDPEQGHATEVWRALVVFAGFQGAQLLAMQLASLFGQALSGTLRFVLVYALAAAALWFPTQREQTSPRPEQRIRYAPLGLLGGAFSGGAAWLYLRWFHPVAAQSAGLSVTNGLEGTLLAVAVVCLAPLVEERFFRGWLQRELEQSLGARRAFAPVLTALAFALAHPAYSFVPVLVFGLVSGALMARTRSLAACVIAHALHNAIALCLGTG